MYLLENEMSWMELCIKERRKVIGEEIQGKDNISGSEKIRDRRI